MAPKPSAFRDHTGERFNHWIALSRAENIGPRTAYVCRCDCGEIRSVMASHLVSGRSKSCGCARPKGGDHPGYKHGASRNNDVYEIWMRMNDRCRNPNSPSSHIYHDKGIRVCPEWQSDYEAFAAYIGPRPSKSHSIDRIDGDKGYEPGNVRWATPKQQARNVSRNRIVSFRGRDMCLAEAAELAGINYGTAKWRVNHGRQVDEASR